MMHKLPPVKPIVPAHPATGVAHDAKNHDQGNLHHHGHGHFQGKHFRAGSGPLRPPPPRPRGPTSRQNIKSRAASENDNLGNSESDDNDLETQQKSVETHGEQKGDSQDSSDQQQQQQQRQAKWKIKAVAKSENAEQVQSHLAIAAAPPVPQRSFASAASIQNVFASVALGAINSKHEQSNPSIRSKVLPEILAALHALQNDKLLMQKTEFSAIKEELVKLSKVVSPNSNSPAQESYRRLLPLMLHNLGRNRTASGLKSAISKLEFFNSLTLAKPSTATVLR